MGILTERNKVSNFSNIPQDNKPQDDKPNIQRKLEEWERPSPTKESLNAKLKQASERRIENISHKTQRATDHYNEVKKCVMDRQSQNTAEALALEARLFERAKKARKHKQERIDVIVKKNKMIEEKVIKKKESDQVSATQLQLDLNEKIEAVSQRKDQMLTKNTEILTKKAMKVEKVKIHDLEKVKELKAVVTSKLDAATDRKMKALSEISTNVSNSSKKKEERVKLLKYSKEADISSAKMKFENKLIEANQRKKNSIFYRKVASAEKNYAQFERVKEISKQRLFDEREVQCKHDNRMMAVMQRKDRLQEEKHEKNEKSNIRREIVLEKHAIDENCSIQNLKIQTTLKINEAAQRRMDRQAKESERAEMTNTKRERALQKLAKIKSSLVQKAKEQTSVKMSEATARRAVHLLQKAEHANIIGTRSKSNPEKINIKSSSSFSITPVSATVTTNHKKEEVAELTDDNINQSFYARLQILFFLISSRIVGMIRNVFSQK